MATAATKRFYGWRPSPPDMRDYRFSANPEVLGQLPVAVDLTNPALPAPYEPTWDQGPLGSCGPHTAAADIVFAAIRQDRLADPPPKPSTLFIYYRTREIMGTIDSDSGVDNRSLLKALAKFGWCDEALMPYDITSFRQAPSEAATQQAATRKIVKYLAVPQNLEQMQACLAGGDPFIFGFSVYSSFESMATEKTGIVPMPSVHDRFRGGHDVQVVGYNAGTGMFNDIPPGHFKFKNSYGVKWGSRGYGFIPFAYATHPQLAGDFWTVQHSAIPNHVPTPAPSTVRMPAKVVVYDQFGAELATFKA